METNEYDDKIKEATQQWMPQWDWLWFKSQIKAESAFDPNAQSSAGAQGLFQFMPDTWADVSERLRFPFHASPFDPYYAIPAGVYYMALMRNGWAAPRPESDRRRLAQASYNAGFGNILKAQKAAGGANDYDTIISELSSITGKKNALETTEYVQRIQEYYDQYRIQQESINGNAH